MANETAEKLRVLILSRNCVTAEGLSAILKRYACDPVHVPSGLRRVGTSQADAALVDACPIAFSDTDWRRLVKVHASRFPLFLIGHEHEAQHVQRMIQEPVAGFVHGMMTPKELVSYVRQRTLRWGGGNGNGNGNGDVSVPPPRVKGRAASLRYLTDREKEVYLSIGKGLTNQGVAKDLNISVKTVEAHKENLKRKLGFKTVNQLVQTAVRYRAHRS
jgi:DNA-binding NarL/FixJ family response regulator